MTLAHDHTHPAKPGSATVSGRDRRVHHRRETDRAWVQVDGGWYRVHDLSLGGLGIDRPVDEPNVGETIEGEIHSRAAGRHLQSSFRATVVRVDDGGRRIGVAFTPMSPGQIDGLLAILSAVEREFVHSRELLLRREIMRRRLRRIGYAVVAVIGIAAIGYATWIVR